MNNNNTKENVVVKSEDLLAEYMLQSNTGEKHSYSEQLHNDDSSGCCLCDLFECGCNILECFTDC